jgi:hypothetical protein
MQCHLGGGPEFSFWWNCSCRKFWYRRTKFHAGNRHSACGNSDTSGQHGDAARGNSDAPGQHGDAARGDSDTSGQHGDAARGNSDASGQHSDAARGNSDAPGQHSDPTDGYSSSSSRHSAGILESEQLWNHDAEFRNSAAASSNDSTVVVAAGPERYIFPGECGPEAPLFVRRT